MTTELYIEGYRLDITAAIPALMNFAIDDIKDFSSRSTTWSKTIVLPGTANNNKLFGHIFQVGQSNDYNNSLPNVNYNFNAAKSAQCIIFQDQIQTFKGVLRLLQINISDGFSGRVEYEVSVFGNLVGLNVALSGALLETLDFSAYNHVYNDANIVASWDNPGGTGYYYPLIDYGTYSTNKHDWDIHTFRPSLYVREYIDKMITDAGYRWQSALFDTPRFKSLIVPHSKKAMTVSLSTLFVATNSLYYYGDVPVVDLFSNPTEFGAHVVFGTVTGSGFTSNVEKTIFTYNGTVTTNLSITFLFEGEFDNAGFGSLMFFLYKNEPTSSLNSIWAGTASASPYQFGLGVTVVVSVAPGDTLQWRLGQSFHDSLSNVTISLASFTISTVSGAVAVPIQIGDTVTMNDNIPQNIRRIDFLVGIVKLFNLYVYEDKFDEKLIYITPYIDFYSKNFSNAVDWTLKLNRNKITKVKPMSELNAKIYKFRYKQDSDYYNELYRKRYNEGYGDRIYDSQFEFTQQTNEFEIVFSSTPLVGYGGEQKVYPTIFKRTGSDASPTEENTDSNIRILQSKKITGISSWEIKNGATSLNTLTKYGYAGHLDDPATPSNDLNFGATKELFFILSAGNLSNNQFNVYWSNYMMEITDKDSKLVTASFYLTAKDIVNLDFSKYIYVDGIAFRLNAIKDYNATKPSDCIVELLKVNSTSRSQSSSNEGPPEGCYLLWSDEQTLDWNTSDPLLYGSCTGNPGDGEEPDPGTTFYLNWSFEKQNILYGYLKIRVNGTLIINSDAGTGPGHYNGTESGSFVINTGDSVVAEVLGTPGITFGGTKRLLVTNAVDGVMSDVSTTSASTTYSFTVLANRDYGVQGSIIK